MSLRLTDRAGRPVSPQQAARLSGGIDLRKYLREQQRARQVAGIVSWASGPGPGDLSLGGTGWAEQEVFELGSEVAVA